ncbi:MAG: GGDEF domain-containing protein [Lachnospiraceae bacterium]|nr:GGDEF domain-containing protein [Lachnospiraceae bacterium]
MKLIPKKNLYLFIFCLIIAVTSISILAIEIRSGDKTLQKQEIKDGWTAKAHGKLYENVALGSDTFDAFNDGDVFELTGTLPQCDIPDPTLEIYSVHSMVDVYVDGEHIYNYGQKYFDAGKMLGYGWNFVSLPEEFEGKTIRIVFHVTEDDSFDGLPSISIINGDSAVNDLLINERIYLAISMFLIVIGSMGMVFAIILSFRNLSALKMFCIMQLAFLIGVYTLANSDLLIVFNLDMAQKCLFEYMSLYTFTIPFTVYFSDWITEKGFPNKLKWFFNIWVIIEFLFAAATFALHFTNIAHMPRFVGYCHICMIVTLILIIHLTVVRRRVTKRLDKGLAFGFALAILVASIELVRYNVEKYYTGFNNNRYSSSIAFAALIVVLTLFIDFMSKIAGNLRKEAEARAFEKMAYMDELTGILNRRGAEEELNKLKGARHPYALVSVDMNLLKMMNDTFGHATGDRALTLLARKLREAFPEPCVVARVGGDEFIAIVPDASKDHVDAHEAAFVNKMNEHNKKGGNVTLSAAYGTAYSDEADTPEKVLKIADDRMYLAKKESKLGRD